MDVLAGGRVQRPRVGLGQQTMVHETGHLLGAGRPDDGSVTGAGVLPVEVYSGTDEDDTPEELHDDDQF